MTYLENFLEVIGYVIAGAIGLCIIIFLGIKGILACLGSAGLVVSGGTWAAMREATPGWVGWVALGSMATMWVGVTLMSADW